MAAGVNILNRKQQPGRHTTVHKYLKSYQRCFNIAARDGQIIRFLILVSFSHHVYRRPVFSAGPFAVLFMETTVSRPNSRCLGFNFIRNKSTFLPRRVSNSSHEWS